MAQSDEKTPSPKYSIPARQLAKGPPLQKMRWISHNDASQSSQQEIGTSRTWSAHHHRWPLRLRQPLLASRPACHTAAGHVFPLRPEFGPQLPCPVLFCVPRAVPDGVVPRRAAFGILAVKNGRRSAISFQGPGQNSSNTATPPQEPSSASPSFFQAQTTVLPLPSPLISQSACFGVSVSFCKRYVVSPRCCSPMVGIGTRNPSLSPALPSESISFSRFVEQLSVAEGKPIDC